jgi:hypothetical protein
MHASRFYPVLMPFAYWVTVAQPAAKERATTAFPFQLDKLAAELQIKLCARAQPASLARNNNPRRMKRPRTLALTLFLSFLSTLGPLSLDMYLPSLPDIGRSLQASTLQVQPTISSYLFGSAVGQIFYGAVSDRVIGHTETGNFSLCRSGVLCTGLSRARGVDNCVPHCCPPINFALLIFLMRHLTDCFAVCTPKDKFA